MSARSMGLHCLVLVSVLTLSACYNDAPGIPEPPTRPANGFVGQWLDADGRPVPDQSVEGEGLVVKTWVVTGHCEWASVTFMLIAWPPGRVAVENDEAVRQYVRDPEDLFEKEGIFTTALAGEFDPDAELPAAAVATGLHREGWEIWTGDEDSLYLVGPDRTERWQRARDQIWCM